MIETLVTNADVIAGTIIGYLLLSWYIDHNYK